MNQTGTAPTTLLLTGVHVVDPRTGTVRSNLSLLLEGGKIVRIAPRQSFPDATSQVEDATGMYVVPGFVDMHTHALQSDESPRDCNQLLLAYGVTGIRQMAGSTELLRARSHGTLDMGEHSPELLSMPGELLTPLVAPTPEAGVAEVRRQKAEGADFIKTIFVKPSTFFATLGEAKRQGLAYDGHLSPGVDPAEASRKGMSVIEHLGPTELQLIATSNKEWLIKLIMKLKPPKPPDLSPAAMKAAGRVMIANPILGRLNGDPDALTKTQRLIDSYSEDKARRLAKTFVENGTWQCPTMIRNATMRGGDDPIYTASPDLRYISSATRTFWSSVAQMFTSKVPPDRRGTLKLLGELEARLLRTFADVGVRMMAGSDYGGGWLVPGVSLHQEFDLLGAAGLSPLKVLQMTTLNPAEFLEREDSMGTVEEGKDANLVILRKNPIESVDNLHGIHGVVRAGRMYGAEYLERLKEGVVARINGENPDEGDAADQAIA